jgi:hypothetical protein
VLLAPLIILALSKGLYHYDITFEEAASLFQREKLIKNEMIVSLRYAPEDNIVENNNTVIKLEKPFDVASKEIFIQSLAKNVSDEVGLAFVEEDGDLWVYSGEINGELEEISLKIDITKLELKKINDWGRGVTNITRMVFYLKNESKPKTSFELVLKRAEIKDFRYEKAVIIPTANYALDKGVVRNKYPLEKGNNSFRILALGDSMTYGAGTQGSVDYNQTFTAILEDMLNNASGLNGRKFEVLNFGIPIYNTELEVDLYNSTAQYYDVDLVIIFFFMNDVEDSKSLQAIMNELKESEKYRYLYASGFDKSEILQLMRQESMIKYYSSAAYGVDVLNNPEIINHTVISQLERFDSLRDGRAWTVISLYNTLPNQDTALKKFSESSGVPYMNLNHIMDKHGYKRIYIYPYARPPDAHPSPFAHEKIAEQVYSFITENGLVN